MIRSPCELFFYVKKNVFYLVILSNIFRKTYSNNTKYTHTYSVLFTTMNYTNHECITIAKKICLPSKCYEGNDQYIAGSKYV